MRARLGVKLFSLVVTTVLLIFGARSCLEGTGPAGPALQGLVRQGVSGVCADASSVAAADNSGSAPPPTLVSGSQGAKLAGLAGLAGLGSSALSCSTTTTEIP